MKKMMIYSILAIGLPLVIFGFVGCMKPPNLTPNYGPEATIESIQKAISSDAPMDPLSIKKNQYVSIDETQVIDTQVPTTISQRLDQVVAYEDKPDQVNLSFKVDMKELLHGNWQQSTQTYSLAIGKDRAPTAISGATTANLTLNQKIAKALSENKPALSIQSLKKLDAKSPLRVTYHNLKREQGLMPTPEIVKSHPNCGGVLKCDLGLRYLRVTFDRVVWDSDVHGTKTAYQIIYSPDIPTYIHDWDSMEELYMTNQYQTCAQVWLEIDNGGQKQTVPILQCAIMRDFQFGM